MIRHEILTSTLRFYKDETDNPYEPYIAICTIQWENPNCIWVRGLHGTITRTQLKEFIKFCVENNIATVKAYRAQGHVIPLMKEVDGRLELNVAKVAEIIKNRVK